MDTEIAVDIMEMSHALDHIVLLSGDGDFRYLTETVQRNGRSGQLGFHRRNQTAHGLR